MMDELTTSPASAATPDLKALVEAFILVSDGAVSVETLAQALEQDPARIEEILGELETEYAGRGIRIQRMRDRVQFVSAPEVSEQVQKFLGLDTAPRLSPASLETLAIIAYRQPVTRPQIEMIRGVNCDGVIHTLLARNLIEPLGELDTVGHPTIYGTTFDFLHYFGLTSLNELPALPSDLTRLAPTDAQAETVRESGTESAPVESPIDALSASAESEPTYSEEIASIE